VKKLKFGILNVAIGLALGLTANAGTIDFEGLPDQYWFYSGAVNIGNYYDGITFGPHTTFLKDFIPSFPAHSGTSVLYDYPDSLIRADFDTPVDTVSIWYSAGYGLTLEAYDSGNNLLTSVSGLANVTTNTLLSVSYPSSSIAYVVMKTDPGQPGSFVIDDLSSPATSGAVRVIPEPTTVALVGISVLSLVGVHRRRKK
jgi:hypothetical protein